MSKAFYRYWGKAKSNKELGPAYHLLPYHCLDVAAVADQWWQYSVGIRRSFAEITGLAEEQARAWVLFFIALHDYGKFDLRFQRKAPEVWKAVNAELSGIPVRLTPLSIKEYYHGPAGLYWFYQDSKERFSAGDDDFYFDDNEDWLAWYGWLAAVTGHHGIVPEDYQKENRDYNLTIVEADLLSAFKQARLQWLEALEHLFLNPAGLSLDDLPPVVEKNGNGQTAATMLAGFCSVSDWVGSSDYFNYDDQPSDDLRRWYDARLAVAGQALQEAGVISQIKPYQNIDVLLNGHSPRQAQCLVEQLPKTQGLTLIEASTGSGKTETALAYAWQLMALGLADSIVFALPTQATANAMLRRLEKAAPLLFANKTNVILAHGRAQYEQNFINLKQACNPQTAQGHEEAWVQCGNWLAQSRKRVFLGQIGVCTVDQVLVSVLPVKHKFVRGFGIGRSVLIIDEVHAYDSYMYGLLDAVLEQQRLVGGSAVLLSATLPSSQKEKLAKAWGCNLSAADTAYPLISHYSDGQSLVYDLAAQPDQQPQTTSIHLELIKTPHLLPDDCFIQRLLDAVEKGAQVCLVCNLVAVAQQLYHQLQARIAQIETLTEDQLLLFHSRFIFADRQQKEQTVLDLFGADPHPENARTKGHLLIATQVVEQSLDLDFDWLITQLCPVDLLFQRMGRLHRHRRGRPEGFADPVCTVLLPTEDDYELHELIYGNSRVLWRTQQCLLQAERETEARVSFPAAYRNWIESVYSEESWPDEPEWVLKSYEAYEKDRYASQMTARQLINSSMNELSDNDSNVAALTRDGEMSLNLIPFCNNAQGERCLLNGELIDNQDDSDRLEAINLNSVAVPKNWSHHGRLPEADKEGLIWLSMRAEEKGRFIAQQGDCIYLYHASTGLNRMEQPEENP
ncbi:CRISPR-associated helicase/endonuclease Cas3 [Methylobacter sp. BlB1]|uniref:CRISPR-associated helicase/endonuclease Cas3 n=1 Tax=Methylobacter sp. BlB1 TaxID=2785914 RepID=UPI001893F3EC|nr:CRISPR-associated helicase/endonuclease Cas3 [Methylobacter sp. BlB1]MBF6649272.1 CRISPR-associated helicase/endonuclease Cas3 [Methylobacter sp. BlB1]